VQVQCPPAAALVTNTVLLEQALVNLAENAAKHTAHGAITFAVGVVDGATEIAVTDTGPGIPASERTHVFERFYRGRGQSSEGAGLGLAIVRASIEPLGAQLDLESVPGEGTTVRLRFPQTATMVSP
jgi:two-component system sensor histidine kinase TctE